MYVCVCLHCINAVVRMYIVIQHSTTLMCVYMYMYKHICIYIYYMYLYIYVI